MKRRILALASRSMSFQSSSNKPSRPSASPKEDLQASEISKIFEKFDFSKQTFGTFEKKNTFWNFFSLNQRGAETDLTELKENENLEKNHGKEAEKKEAKSKKDKKEDDDDEDDENKNDKGGDDNNTGGVFIPILNRLRRVIC